MMAAIVPEDFARDFARFADRPIDYVGPERLAAMLGIGPAATERLAAAPRFAKRLSGLLIEDLGTCRADAAGAGDLRIALLPPAQVDRLPLAIGCLCHADAIRRIILGQARARLVAAVGDDLYRLALHAPDFGFAADTENEEALPLAIVEAGTRLFLGWLRRLPRPVARRVALMLPEGTLPGGVSPSGGPGEAPPAAMLAYLAEAWRPEPSDAGAVR
ncbi:hypothetical protein GCM10011611_08580 [Aliidongia dinghuensis]|uniref:Uncharacterized protein n=1 Tax=Aliidongia dinghuensis TaxID=1867774 RepID=A0A8J2YQK9_9PROT|nr:SctK family type III secretion system sorting platform protein [Aliidongia dinghuensis]GGF05378.1 hypothetical protein GCM10011611_08580 [Aliidongia dinghuensis]